MSILAVEPCFNEKKIKPIVGDLKKAIQKDFCKQGIKPAHLQWISQKGLPQIMNRSFLGVEPPPNWQILTDEIVQDCFKEGDLCQKATQEQFVECLRVKTPTILLQLGPWMAENCKKINAEVVEKWPDKKRQVLELINQFEIESKTE